MSSALKWWSKDTSESAYSLPEKKKSMLSYQLSLILMKYQAKFSIEFMFFLTMVVVYIPAVMLAKKRKKEIAEYVAQPVVLVKTEQVKTNGSETIVTPPPVNKTEEIKKPINTGVKRKPGAQPKA
jgi:hypothetical protein